MKIRLDVFPVVLDKIIEHAKELGIEEVDIEDDYYWHVDIQERYKPYSKPDPSLGQLSEDFDRLMGILEGDEEPHGFALTSLAAILLYIGDRHSA